MRRLSKSKLMAFRQCPKRLWLELHKPELKSDTSQTQARFTVGHQVGEIARQIYDPKGRGSLVDIERDGFDRSFSLSQELLNSAKPIFEAGFSAEGAMAFADVMLPVRRSGATTWRMIEVKSSTRVKDYHRDDVAVQAFVAQQSGVPLTGVAVAHIDSSWEYPGDQDYRGLLRESDLTEEALGRAGEVREWIESAQKVAAKPRQPRLRTGPHCCNPYDCGFLAYCQSKEKQAEYPLSILPGPLTKAAKAMIEQDGIDDIRDMPDALLNQTQRRVKEHTLSGRTFFDAKGAAEALKPHGFPAYFLDFETIQFGVPIWPGTRPYQMIPFQFSLFQLSRTGQLDEVPFLDLAGGDPSGALAEQLVAACGKRGPIFVYNAGFERGRIKELADRFPILAASLLALNERIVDLLPIARACFYHPDQLGSWSIKAVLPAVAPDLNYAHLEGVQDGLMAMDAYLEAIRPETQPERRETIRQQLLDYCRLDTYGMVRLWQHFSGNNDLVV
jgi:hypothetical protein